MEKQKNKQIIGFIICAILVAGCALVLSAVNPLQRTQEQLSNFLYYERHTDNPIVVIGIDSKSVSPDQGLGRIQEWSRTNYAKVIDNLLEYQPAVIGLDIFFRTPSSGISGNDLKIDLERLDVEGIRKKYVDGTVHPEDSALSELIKNNPNIFLVSSTLIDDKADLPKLNTPPYLPNKVFYGDETQIGHNAFVPGLSGLIYKSLPAILYKEITYPSLSVAMVMKALGLTDIKIEQNKLFLSNNETLLTVPLEDFQMNINFTSKTKLRSQDAYKLKDILYIPFIDVYNNKYPDGFDPNSLKDKIILIGAWYRDSGDNYLTPIDTQNSMYGVAIHAQAIQTILDQAWLYNQSFAAQAITIVILTLLCLALVFGLRIGWALPAVGLLILFYTIPYAHLMFRQLGIIVNLVYPPLTIILAAIVGYAYRYMTEFRQKTKVTTALGQFVNADVAQGVLDSTQNRVEKRGEKRQITVIFTDIKGFTTISENLQAQSVVALLNEYLEVMSQVIVRNNGIVDKYEGDAVMAFFEEKEGLPSHELRAAQAALDMRAELPKLLEKWRNDPPLPGGETKPDIDFRVGVSSGEAIVGTIGSSEHIQYTAIGDIVNLGSRLEGANKKYETNILLAEATYEAIKNSFECRYVDVIKVKGKNKAVKTYQLICRKGDLPADQAELIAAYDKGIKLYFERKFQEASDHFQNEVLKKWPRDYLANVYAARAQKCVLIPPAADWDFVYKMESK